MDGSFCSRASRAQENALTCFGLFQGCISFVASLRVLLQRFITISLQYQKDGTDPTLQLLQVSDES